MPRRQRKEAKCKQLVPDQRYQNEEVRRFTNMLMLHGKYSVAYKMVCWAIEQTLEKAKLPPCDDKQQAVKQLFDELIQKAGPEVEIKTKRLGGATYPVPVVVQTRRRVTLAFRWMIQYSRKRKGAIKNCLAQEFLDVLEGRGGTINERENLHRMARANMAFANIKQRGT
ncbi:MAG: 30S ribosomal protein S7 [Legionellales bacterium]|nr:30S ribosomal protein S7 [Legionellales bacterium]|tara:strand:+ start:285 stop:791 length:507 start_codon:yes stop_codon:yes gene_type:complete